MFAGEDGHELVEGEEAGVIRGRSTCSVLDAGVGARGDESPNGGDLAAAGRPQKRGGPFNVGHIQAAPPVDQQPDQPAAAGQGGQMEGCPAQLTGRVERRAMV